MIKCGQWDAAFAKAMAGKNVGHLSKSNNSTFSKETNFLPYAERAYRR